MTNLASVLEVADFTKEEIKLVQMHIDNYSEISWENMSSAWRDENGNLCISYENGKWYHYNTEKGEWW